MFYNQASEILSLIILERLSKMGFQQEKKVVRELFKVIENSNHPETIENAIKPFVSDDFTFQGKIKWVG